MGCECGQYLGCGTKGNKVKWSIFGSLMLLGAVFMMVSVTQGAQLGSKLSGAMLTFKLQVLQCIMSYCRSAVGTCSHNGSPITCHLTIVTALLASNQLMHCNCN